MNLCELKDQRRWQMKRSRFGHQGSESEYDKTVEELGAVDKVDYEGCWRLYRKRKFQGWT